jgi:hypothetical protein
MRALLLLIPLLAGCVHPRAPQFDPADFHSSGIERSLQYWIVSHPSHATNHFYVCATEVYGGELVRALVYWPEGGRLLDYAEVSRGNEPQAWRLRPKVDREAVRTDERISASNDLVPHRVWIRWVKQCIASGRAYVVTLKQSKAVFPQAQNGTKEPPPSR